MNTQGIFIAHPQTAEQVNALQAFMQALKINFEVSKEETYRPEFVEKLLESRQQARDGKVTRVKKENLKEFLGL
jgi:adenylate kinase family enzyme